jgi:hypothetical protein
VEGTQVHEVGVILRGRAQEHEPRSVRSTCVTGLIPHVRRTDDSGCPLEERGGERRQRTSSVRTRLRRARQNRDPRSSRTRPSLGPETRARQTLLNSPRSKVERGSAIDSVSRSGKPGQPGRTGTGAGSNGRMRGLPRVTASQEEGVMREEKEEDHGPRPCKEKREPGFGCPYVGMQLQKSSGGVGSQIPSHARSQKSGGASERGPS